MPKKKSKGGRPLSAATYETGKKAQENFLAAMKTILSAKEKPPRPTRKPSND